MRTKTFLIVLALLWSTSQIIAQGPGGRQMPTIGVVSGKVVDDKGQPVEYATVSLISMRDSSLLTGGITDKNGEFKLSELKLGVYILDIKFLGFEHKQIKPVYLFPKGRGKGQGTEQNFGEIKLENSAVAIDDVNVVADKSHVQYQIDKKVVNVSQDVNSAGGTAVDILENTPSVNVDIDGNVELRGSSNFTVLIDGKPTVLEASEALQQIPANLIENIEIITNPSAKFDPDGAAGIINVVMKRKKNLGLNGLFNVSAGTGDKYKANTTLSYKVGKLNFTVGVDYRDDTRYGSGKMNKSVFGTDDVTYYTNYNGDRNRHMYGLGFKGGIDYYINDNNTISISGNYSNREMSRFSKSYYNEYTDPVGNNVYYVRESDAGYDGTSYNISLDYALKFKKPNQKLDILLYYSNWEGNRNSDLSTDTTDASWDKLDTESVLSKDNETGPRNEYRYKMDYVTPIGLNGIMEAGLQGRYNIDSEKFIFEDFNSETGLWEINNNKSSDVDFTRNIQAAYATYASKIWGLDYKIGLRTEYTNRALKQLTTNEEFLIERFDFFPSAYLTKQLSKTQQIQASYSRRINRPRGRQLDPTPSYDDPKNIRQGNVELEPEYVDSYELNFQQQFKKSFLAFELYFRKTNNAIDWSTESGGGDTLIRTFANLAYENALGAELSANLSLNKWWRLNASGTGYYYESSGNIDDEDVGGESFNWNFRINNTFSFKTNTRLQFSAFYRGPSATAQGSREAFFFSNLALRQDFMNRKLSITAQLRDVFGAMKFRFKTETSSYYTDTEFRREGQVFTLSLTYRLNNFKQKRNGRNGNGNGEDMDMELDI